MGEVAIKVENLSKKYFIGKSYSPNLRESLSGILTRKKIHKEFWALKQINFEINKGEIIGIIGKNGAGKSTLLKILSRITYPTEGRVELNGKVASLLEVGTGFHPELTGRENIFLNGSILGMNRSEIKILFDEIVDFSGVETFIDTPVKRYSSGMYVRLAFSVAAHLRSDILLVDEVLSVGDRNFQEKCLDKIKNEFNKNKTIILVSHDLNNIQSITNKTILLNNAELINYDLTNLVIPKYLDVSSSENGNSNIDILVLGNANGEVIFKKDFEIHVSLKNLKIINGFSVDIGINNIFGQRVSFLSYDNKTLQSNSFNCKINFLIRNNHFVPGVYTLDIYCSDGDDKIFHQRKYRSFNVQEGNEEIALNKNLGNYILDYTSNIIVEKD